MIVNEMRAFQDIFSKWRLYNNLITIFALLGLALAILEFELGIQYMLDNPDTRHFNPNLSGFDAMKSKRFNLRDT